MPVPKDEAMNGFLIEQSENVRSATPAKSNALLFENEASYWRNSQSGLTYVRARWLDTSIGQWISVDPVDGEPHYNYVNNSPTTNVDPSGLQSHHSKKTSAAISVDQSTIFARMALQGSRQLQRISTETLKVLGDIIFLITQPLPVGPFEQAPDVRFLIPMLGFAEVQPSQVSLFPTGPSVSSNLTIPSSSPADTSTSLIAVESAVKNEVSNLFATVPTVRGASKAIFIASHLDVVFDGRQQARVADPQGSAKVAANTGNTSMHDMNDRPFGAYTDFFYVLPRYSHHNPMNIYANQFDAWDVQLGDIAAFIYKGRVLFAVAGELGPHFKLGEASAAVLGKLKHRPPESMPNRDMGGFDDRDDVVVTIIFPGTRHVGFNKDKVPKNMLPQTMVNDIGRQKLEELGAKLTG